MDDIKQHLTHIKNGVKITYMEYLNKLNEINTNTRYSRTKLAFGASGAGLCHLKHYFRSIGEKRKEVPFDSMCKMRLGTLVHEDIQNALNYILTPLFKAYDSYSERKRIQKLKQIEIFNKEKERKRKEERQQSLEKKQRELREEIRFAKSPSLVKSNSPSVLKSILPTGKILSKFLSRRSVTRGRPAGSERVQRNPLGLFMSR